MRYLLATLCALGLSSLHGMQVIGGSHGLSSVGSFLTRSFCTGKSSTGYKDLPSSLYKEYALKVLSNTGHRGKAFEKQDPFIQFLKTHHWTVGKILDNEAIKPYNFDKSELEKKTEMDLTSAPLRLALSIFGGKKASELRKKYNKVTLELLVHHMQLKSGKSFSTFMRTEFGWYPCECEEIYGTDLTYASGRAMDNISHREKQFLLFKASKGLSGALLEVVEKAEKNA